MFPFLGTILDEKRPRNGQKDPKQAIMYWTLDQASPRVTMKTIDRRCFIWVAYERNFVYLFIGFVLVFICFGLDVWLVWIRGYMCQICGCGNVYWKCTCFRTVLSFCGWIISVITRPPLSRSLIATHQTSERQARGLVMVRFGRDMRQKQKQESSPPPSLPEMRFALLRQGIVLILGHIGYQSSANCIVCGWPNILLFPLPLAMPLSLPLPLPLPLQVYLLYSKGIFKRKSLALHMTLIFEPISSFIHT